MENQPFQVKIANFEGPFGVLLGLIEERKLHINDVSLAQVTEDYLAYVNSLEDLPSADISSFIIVAATLILIKSKSLLPNLSLTEEEEGDIRNLEDRLKQYELYIRLGLNIKSRFGKEIIFAAEERKNNTLVFLPDEQITTSSMMVFAHSALGKVPKKVFLPQVEVKKVISIEEMIDKLTDRIKNSLKMNFKEFAGGAKTKEEKVFVIVGFLAMLEMVRQGMLKVAQENNFEDIIIENSPVVVEEEIIEVEIHE